ncbi:actin-binding protein IPP [Cimex lectularius]|uniref:Kelch-like protein diablo n=1 Tax=Cimex lectularius TaxID=79782 RepID=A0A8I6RI55_CIMLE|nr:actin-binding protein IPP [Cimex lectularius]
MPPMRSKSNEGISNYQLQKYELIIGSTKSTDKPVKIFKSANHSNSVLQNMNLLRKNNKFCDVEIVAGDNVIKAHRSVLSASSPYFQAMFSTGLIEEEKDRIEIHYVEPKILTLIVDFIYTGELSLCQENVQDLIIAGDMLELKEVVNGCTEFLRNELHISNAVGIYRFAEDHNCLNLAKSAAIFIENNFPSIVFEEEFCELPKNHLLRFLDSELLKVDSEYQVFQAVLSWISYDLPSRKRYVFELLTHVRLPLISASLLDRSIAEVPDASLKVALRSVRKDLISKKGNLVPLIAYPRLCAKKTIFIIGGEKRELLSSWTRSLECTYDTIERFDCFTGEWYAGIEPMETGRILPGAAALNGKIYVVGGEHECEILADGAVYDPLTNTWSKIASMVEARCEFGLCAVDGDLYALGGWVGSDIGGTIERYDMVLDEWHLEGSLPEPRFSMGVVSYEGNIYIVGGCTHNQRHVQDFIKLDPSTGKCSSLAPMLEPRSQIGVAVLDGYLYVVGGTNKDNDVLRTVERYSFEQNKWSPVGTLKMGRASPAVAAAGGYLYVLGGDQTHEINFYRAQVTMSSVERYDPVRNVWEESVPLRDSRSEAAAVVL